MAHDDGCAENNDTNLNGKHGPTTIEKMLSGQHYTLWHFHFFQWENIDWDIGEWMYNICKLYFFI